MSESIFTKIIRGDIPSYIIYEDELTFAFLDIYPVQPGHTLVIPKKQVPYVWDLEEQDYTALMLSAKKIATKMKEVLGKRYIGLQVVGIDVPHAHLHLIPFNTSEEFRNIPDRSVEPNNKELESIQKILKFN